MLAALVGDLMRKIRRIEERLVTDDFDRERHRQFFGLAADEDAAGFDLLHYIPLWILSLTDAELTFGDMLEMSFVRRVQSLEAEKQPRDSAFEESNAEPREAVEDAVVYHVGKTHGKSPRMPQRMDRDIHVHLVHTEAVVAAAVDRETAAEPVRL